MKLWELSPHSPLGLVSTPTGKYLVSALAVAVRGPRGRGSRMAEESEI